MDRGYGDNGKCDSVTHVPVFPRGVRIEKRPTGRTVCSDPIDKTTSRKLSVRYHSGVWFQRCIETHVVLMSRDKSFVLFASLADRRPVDRIVCKEKTYCAVIHHVRNVSISFRFRLLPTPFVRDGVHDRRSIFQVARQQQVRRENVTGGGEGNWPKVQFC